MKKDKQNERPRMQDYYSCTPRISGFPYDTDYQDCIMLDMNDPRVDPNTKAHKEGLLECLRSMGKFREDELIQFTTVPYSATYRKESAAYYKALDKYEENHP